MYEFKIIIESVKKYKNDRKLAVWGCGVDGKKVAQNFIANGVTPDLYCDSNQDKQGGLFLNRFPIVAPDTIVQDDNYYIVIAASSYTDEMIKFVEDFGKMEKNDYIVFSMQCSSEMLQDDDDFALDILLEYILHIRREFDVQTYFFVAPSVHRTINPSELEMAFKSFHVFIHEAVEHLAWLQSKPPHIASMYKGFEHYTDEFIKGIFTWPRYSIASDGKLVNINKSGLNYVNGKRVTVDLPDEYEHFIHFFGCSTMAGLGVEDQYTIPSCFQRCVNENFPNKYYSINHAGLFRTKANMLDLILCNHSFLHKNDILIIETHFFTDLIEKCVQRQIPCLDLQYLFNRPHDLGEVFFDGIHVNHIANQAIANKMFDMVFPKPIHAIDMPSIIKKYSVTLTDTSELDSCIQKFSPYVKESTNAGAVVVNCNPFTLGHRYLIERAAQLSDVLYVFVVEENKSVFPFEDRISLVKKSLSDLENVVVLPSGELIISTITLPEYFTKEVSPDQIMDASLDIELFGGYVAPLFGIKTRYVGEEPIDMVTRQYNVQMKEILPTYGIRVCEIPRHQTEGGLVISASHVRKMLAAKDYEGLSKMVPPIVEEYLVRGVLTVYIQRDAA